MIHWLTLTLVLTTTVLAAIVIQLARTLATQDNLIRALQYSVRLSKENAATQQHRADMLEKAFIQQQERISLLVAQNGDLEDRNACLERVSRKAGLAFVLSLPVIDGPTVLASKGLIGMN